jgi:hypothetical protein
LIEVKNNNLFLTLVIKMYILKICLLVGLLGVQFKRRSHLNSRDKNKSFYLFAPFSRKAGKGA